MTSEKVLTKILCSFREQERDVICHWIKRYQISSAFFQNGLTSKTGANLVLVLVQLEQVVPGWWLTLQDLAEQLGTDRATLSRAITKLERRGMLQRVTISNSGGTFIWWVKRDATDEPDPDDEPAWVLRSLGNRTHCRVPMSKRWEWARQHGVPRTTMQSFLGGYHRVLRGRWEIVSSPYGGEPDELLRLKQLSRRERQLCLFSADEVLDSVNAA
jgi:hypothetical protein